VAGLLVCLIRDSWVWRVPLSLHGIGRILSGLSTNISTIPTYTEQAPPRVSDLATSTVFGSDPATEYLLTVRSTFSRSSTSISKTWQSGYQGYIPATLWAVSIQFWYSRGYAYTFRWN